MNSIKLSLEHRELPLAADGSDFVPVFASIVDQKGVPKVLASEHVFFEVEGPADIIGGQFNQSNPTHTEFGQAVALIRARTIAGKIRVMAYVNGLAPDEISFESVVPYLRTRSGKPMVDGFGGRRDKLLGHFGGVGRRVEAGQLVDGAISQAG